LPSVVLLIAIGAILGGWVRGKSVDPKPAAALSVMPPEGAYENSPAVLAKIETSRPLTVDMLPLVPQSGRSAKDHGRNNANSLNPNGHPKRDVPNRASQNDSDGRDYGI